MTEKGSWNCAIWFHKNKEAPREVGTANNLREARIGGWGQLKGRKISRTIRRGEGETEEGAQDPKLNTKATKYRARERQTAKGIRR